jgi:hypothetical protein
MPPPFPYSVLFEARGSWILVVKRRIPHLVRPPCVFALEGPIELNVRREISSAFAPIAVLLFCVVLECVPGKETQRAVLFLNICALKRTGVSLFCAPPEIWPERRGRSLSAGKKFWHRSLACATLVSHFNTWRGESWFPSAHAHT